MPMSDQPQLLIRDGIKQDIPNCIAIDNTFRTEYVWQMNVHEESDETQITLRKQRLPRPLEAQHLSDARRLDIALAQKDCFIVIVESISDSIVGFISMRLDVTYQLAYLQDIVVDRPFRRQNLGSRLISIARLWATEKNSNRIIFEIPTTNYPCIQFAQSQGFVHSGFNDQYLPNQEIAVFFSLAL